MPQSAKASDRLKATPGLVWHQRTFDELPHPILLLNATREVMGANRAAQVFLGAPLSSLYGEELATKGLSTSQENGSVGHRAEVQHRDGRWLPVDLFECTQGSDHQRQVFVVLLQPVSSVGAVLAQPTAVPQSSADGELITCSLPHRGGQRTVIFVNEAQLALSALPVQSVVGRTLAQVLGAEDPDVLRDLQKVMQSNLTAQAELVMKGANGRLRWVQVTITAAGQPGDPTLPQIVRVQDINRVRSLEQELLRVESSVRHRLGLDLHDSLGQDLTGLAFLLQALRAETPTSETSVTQKLAQMAAVLSKAINSAHSIARGLAPLDWQHCTLKDTIVRLTQEYSLLHAVRVVCRVRGAYNSAELRTLTENLYRIAQEALSNALRHANATRIRIVLSIRPTQLTLSILDNGEGMHPSVGSTGIGLGSMNYRARLLGASLTVEPRRAGGTRVVCRCPLPSQTVEVPTDIREVTAVPAIPILREVP